MNELNKLAQHHRKQALLYERLANGLPTPRSRAVLLGFAREDLQSAALLLEADYLQNGYARLQEEQAFELPALPCEELFKQCILEEAALARRYLLLADGCTDAYLRSLFLRLSQKARQRVTRLPILLFDLPSQENAP